MTRISVSGASDDLIEVDGDVQLEGSPDGYAGTVKVNGADLLSVTFESDGLWRVRTLGQVPGVRVEVFPTPGEDEERVPPAPRGVPSYSDYAIVEGDIVSVSIPGDSWALGD